MPKGDAEQLRADLDDGYARISWLLMEALACAPLTGTQHSVIWCVLRATYGWAQQGDRQSGRLATLTAEDIATATGAPKRTVSGAVAHLCNAGVLLREQVTANGRCAYGVNPDIAQWGLPGPEWRHFYVCLQEAREAGVYTQNHVGYAETRIPIRKNAYTPTQNHVVSPPTNPRAPRVSGPPTTSLTTSHTENVNDLAIPAECATLDSQAEDPCEGQGTPTHKARSETPEQAAIHRLWDAFELPDKPSPGKGEKPTYAAVVKLIQEHGIPLFDELASIVSVDPTARLPDGAKPWPWFCKQVRSYMAAPWKWAQAADHRLPPKPRGEFILLNDGTTCPASEWDYTQRWQVGEMKAADNWDASTGRTKRPTPGYTCIDGRFYPPQSDPVTS